MVYLESSSTDPYFNLALEEYIFEHMNPSNQYFMLWQNENAIVIGKYQNTAEEINQAFVEAHGIRVVRRLSGGGAVYHDKGNLNFTFIVNQADHADFNFNVFVRPVIRTLESLGVHAEFNGRNDILIDGRKFSGNSQYARHGRLLHHGCIMLDSNLTNVADALQVKEAKFDSKSIKSVHSRVTTINENTSHPIDMDTFKRTLCNCILGKGTVKPQALTQEELWAVHQLRDEKYATWEWNYGNSPSYDMRKEQKFETGLVTADLKVETGRIKAIRFYGDFFGNGDIAELEDALISHKLDCQLVNVLERVNVSYYMNGISANDIVQMLL